MTPSSEAIVMFAKAPVPGRVKTRLVPDLTAEQAASLHRVFIEDMGTTILQVAEDRGSEPILAVAGDTGHETFTALVDRGFRLVGQGDGDLGARLARILDLLTGEGAEKVCVLGSDSPTLPASIIHESFEAVSDADVVLGPSFDGGYYLVAIDEPRPEIFEDVDWSTPDVLSQTLERCRQASLLSELLAFWYDVDEITDLKFLKDHLLGYLCRGGEDPFPSTSSMLRKLTASGILDGP